ncbi:MAG TPA: trehalose-6-phosphate synthase [Acidothermales bacterium]
MTAEVLIASNRGPVSFQPGEDGSLTAQRGGGGLVSGLTSAVRDAAALWICTAMSDYDREAAREAPNGRLDSAGHDTEGLAVRMLEIDPLTFQRAYNAVANSTLWFVHHLLYDTPLTPNFDAGFRREWTAYVSYNEAFAVALAEEAAPAARVVVQDYHLSLVPRMLRQLRPDIRIGHFTHTPWATPDYYGLLPDDVGADVLRGILGAEHAGFLCERWADAFLDCCECLDDAVVDRAARTVSMNGHTTTVAIHGLGSDGDFLRRRAAEQDVEARRETLLASVRDTRVIVRVDRTELSKNIVRGLAAYRELLRTHPEWRGRVTHVAFAYPSRHDLPEYREYTASVLRIAREIEDEFGTAEWTPLLLQVDDDFPRSLAAYRLAEVLIVNPLRDGMNLVAKEVPVVSERGCALVLSREAGAYYDLGDDAIVINPYDISATAEALHEALTMDADERFERSKRLAEASTALPPQRWFADQLAALRT